MLNAVVLWNTWYTDAALGQLRASGGVDDADAARLSPLVDAHVNMLGRYAFTQPPTVGLRPLRDPDASSEESCPVSHLRDRVIRTVGTRGELTLYELDRATEIRCARCAGRSVTRSVAVLGDNWTSLWCKSCYLAMPDAARRAPDAPSRPDPHLVQGIPLPLAPGGKVGRLP